MIMPVLFGPVDFEPGQVAAMPAHLQTEAALLAREWFGNREGDIARSLGLSVDQYRSALKARHAFSPFGVERIVDPDDSEDAREAALKNMLSHRRNAGRLLAWMLQQENGETVLSEGGMDTAIGGSYGAARYSIRVLHRFDLIEPLPGRRFRKPGWRVTKAGRDAAARFDLVASEAST